MVVSYHMKIDIVILLGNFHTQMSFLGTIGYIMKNSGIEKVLSLIYGEKTAPHIMSGKAYARAMRSHFLIAGVLMKILLEQVRHYI